MIDNWRLKLIKGITSRLITVEKVICEPELALEREIKGRIEYTR